MEAVSLNNDNVEELMKVLEKGNAPTCEQQVQLLCRAVTAGLEEMYRVAEIISVITPNHRAMPDENVVGGMVSALYFAAPLDERQEILGEVLQTRKVADADEEVPDA